MTILERAVEIAARAHAGQKDLLGEVYLLHPLRVMLAGKTEEERIVGVLHDVLEDCGGWDDDLRLFLKDSPAIWSALCALCHTDDESYPSYIQRIKAAGPLAVKVKIADINDNVLRNHQLWEKNPDLADRLMDKYSTALKELQK